MPLVLPKQKRKSHPDGQFAKQICIINKRNVYAEKNKNINFISLLKPKLNSNQCIEICTSVKSILAAATSKHTSSRPKKNILSKECIEWLNQQHIKFFEKKQNCNTLYIGIKKSVQKYNYNLIFDSNVAKNNYTIELCCLNVLMCCDLENYRIYLDNNICFHTFINYLKESNNILYIYYLKLIKNIDITIL